MPESEVDMVARWRSLLSAWPRDGWDGAAAVIAAHDQRMIDYEHEIDREYPGWHKRAGITGRRSTAPA